MIDKDEGAVGVELPLVIYPIYKCYFIFHYNFLKLFSQNWNRLLRKKQRHSNKGSSNLKEHLELQTGIFHLHSRLLGSAGRVVLVLELNKLNVCRDSIRKLLPGSKRIVMVK